MSAFCDLHTHSVFSDGTCTPEEIVDAAVGMGLTAVALCDHNTVAGLPDFLRAAEGKDILAVPAMELSTQYGEKELHIVGLFIPPERFGRVTVFLEEINGRKERSNRALVEALNEGGYPLDYEAIKAATPNGHINRAHIASEMVKRGHVGSIKEAFQGLLSPEGEYYRPPERLDAFEGIAFLRSIGAVPVLAHPFLDLDEERLRRFLPEAKKHGLLGMETRYSLFSPQTTALAQRLAEEFGLKPSGGSDFHGANKPDIRLGTGRGDLQVPARYAEELKQLA